MAAGLNRVLKLAFARLRHAHVFDRRSPLRRVGSEITRQPPRNDPTGEGRVLGIREQVVGLVQRNKALWMSGREEDFGGVFDSDRLVQRCVKDEEWLFQARNSVLEALCARVLDELPFDKELASGKIDFGGTASLDLLEARSEVLQYVADIGRRADRRHGTHFRNVLGDGQDRRAAERVADHQRWCLIVVA